MVNDEPRSIRIEPRQTLRELARAICDDDGPNRSLIVSVVCDGKPVPLDQLDHTLDTPAETFGEVALQTQPMAALIAQSLGEAIEVFRAADRTRVLVADLLAQGQQHEALRRLGELFADWKQVQDTVAVVMEALRGSSPPDGDAESVLAAPLAAITAHLRELRSALKAGDLVLVGDVLRFELETPFADWIAAMERLRSPLPAGV